MTSGPAFDHPEVSLAQAIGALAEGWGLDAHLRPMAGERDLNFCVLQGDRPLGVLKVAHRAESPESLAMQIALLDHLATVAPDLPLPRVIRTTTGAATWPVAGYQLRLVSWCPGTPLAEARRDPALLREVGVLIGRISHVLRGFGDIGAHRSLVWDIRRSQESRQRLAFVATERRELLDRAIQRFEAIQDELPKLRHGVIHGDLNDWNVLVAADGRSISGIIDVGDATFSPVIADLAIAMTYAAMRCPSALLAMTQVVAGCASVFPIEEREAELLGELVLGRLASSLTISAERRQAAKGSSGSDYWFVSEAPAWELLTSLEGIPPAHLRGALRRAAGWPGSPLLAAYQRHVAADTSAAPILDRPLEQHALQTLSWASASDPMVAATVNGDLASADAAYEAVRRGEGFDVGIGRWGERRAVYSSEAFSSRLMPGARRDTHLGLDVFAPAGSRLHTPFAARVVAAANCQHPQDYGGVVLLAHEIPGAGEFQTLWGHLDPQSITGLKPGDILVRGEPFATLGSSSVNGGWVPHLHLQLVLTGESDPERIFGVGEGTLVDLWADLYPDPAALAGVPPEALAHDPAESLRTRGRRDQLFAPSLKLSYRTPLEIVRGRDVWLYDAKGRAYLDCYNNVAHVGHCHPAVTEAICRQARLLNTNTRYLHRLIGEYAERLTATFPSGLDTVFFTNSGSEANELALRMARTITGRQTVAVLDWAYHGNTQAAIDVSPYKYKRAGGQGRRPFITELACPDPYRAPSDWPASEVGIRYGESLTRALCSGEAPAAFIAETIPSCAGQVFLPHGFLPRAFESVRAAGGLCILDEVQVGFGRVGTDMWAFREHGVVPDFVTLGKPMGNGHPIGAVVTTRAIAESFANGMEFFSTFGGNPVSCAAGLAVLDVLEAQGLLENAKVRGNALLEAFSVLMGRHRSIGDVRGRGLFLGIELVTDRTTKEPATQVAARVVEACLARGVLIGTDGPHDNVLKLRPPMTFQAHQHDRLMAVLDEALREVDPA